MCKSGDTNEVVQGYLAGVTQQGLEWHRQSPGTTAAWLRTVVVRDAADRAGSALTTASEAEVIVEFSLRERVPNLQLGIGLLDAAGEQIFGSAPQDSGQTVPCEPGCYSCDDTVTRADFTRPHLWAATVLWVPGQGRLDCADDLRFAVQETAGFSNATPGGRPGQLAVRCGWRVSAMTDHPTTAATARNEGGRNLRPETTSVAATWSADAIGRFWEYWGRRDDAFGDYFSHQFGGAIAQLLSQAGCLHPGAKRLILDVDPVS